MRDITVVNVSRRQITVLESKTGRQGGTGLQGLQGQPGLSAFQLWQQLPGNANKTIEEFYTSQTPIDVIDGGNF